ncbi:hypothetical protein HHI36_009835 [Cryptolaemus montrouzieri]|uniref:Uncharacterized protein n=1 Tax=Cryptolaemus montrouzieri TaxID=559131 RepID=A0ABD2MH21_9CUCU
MFGYIALHMRAVFRFWVLFKSSCCDGWMYLCTPKIYALQLLIRQFPALLWEILKFSAEDSSGYSFLTYYILIVLRKIEVFNEARLKEMCTLFLSEKLYSLQYFQSL